MSPKNNERKRNAKGQFVKGDSGNINNNYASKYKEEYCERIIEFFSKPITETFYKKEYYKDGTLKCETPIIKTLGFPTFELFAAEIRVDQDTLLNWRDKYPSFRSAYTLAKQLQKGMLISGATSGNYDSNFSKFMATNNFDMTDKKEVKEEVTGNLLVDDQTLAIVERVGKRLNNEK